MLAITKPGAANWTAWRAYYARHGPRFANDTLNKLEITGGAWTVPSEYPPEDTQEERA